jgi:protein-tyrosine phosphatase
MLREFDPASAAGGDLDVPDPYFGGADGFDHVLDLVDAACRGLLEHTTRRKLR